MQVRGGGGGGGWSPVLEFRVFGQGQKHAGGQHEASHLEEEIRVSSPTAMSLAPQSLANIWNGYQETQAALAGTQLYLCTFRCKLKSKTDIKYIFI